MTPELLPCPHCGGTDIRITNHGRIGRYEHKGDEVWSMCCYNCGATFPNRYRRELLVEDWNRRVAPPTPVSEGVLGELPKPSRVEFVPDDVMQGDVLTAFYTADQMHAFRQEGIAQLQAKLANWKDAYAGMEQRRNDWFQIAQAAKAQLAQGKERGEWIAVSERLPEPAEVNDDIGVIGLWEQDCKPDCGHDVTITNIHYLRNHPQEFSHWALPPPLPANDSPHPQQGGHDNESI